VVPRARRSRETRVHDAGRLAAAHPHDGDAVVVDAAAEPRRCGNRSAAAHATTDAVLLRLHHVPVPERARPVLDDDDPLPVRATERDVARVVAGEMVHETPAAAEGQSGRTAGFTS